MVSFSNRCFPTKAIAAWLYADDGGHMSLVRAYFERSDCWKEIRVTDLKPNPGQTDPLYAVLGRRAANAAPTS